MTSLDGPTCKHHHNLFNPEPCKACEQEARDGERPYQDGPKCKHGHPVFAPTPCIQCEEERRRWWWFVALFVLVATHLLFTPAAAAEPWKGHPGCEVLEAFYKSQRRFSHYACKCGAHGKPFRCHDLDGSHAPLDQFDLDILAGKIPEWHDTNPYLTRPQRNTWDD